MTIAYPYLLLVPIVIWVAYLLLKEERTGINAASVSVFKQIVPSLRIKLRLPILGTLATLLVLSTTIGAARLREVKRLPHDKDARNIMLDIDLSKSMDAVDFSSDMGLIDRLSAVRSVVDEFIAERQDDRIGLVVFGTAAYLHAPLTLDHNLVRQMVERLESGMAGDDTAIGEGLALSLKRIADVPSRTKAVILLTDGVNNSGNVKPLEAAAIARDLGVKVYTIGIGSTRASQARGIGGMFGAQQFAEFDEETLKAIAKTTGGEYFNASDVAGLKKVYEKIDELETTKSEEHDEEIVHELFLPFAVSALLAYLSYFALSQGVFRRLP